MIKDDEWTINVIAASLLVACVCISAMLLVAYAFYARRNRLNWFEKQLLAEAAEEGACGGGKMNAVDDEDVNVDADEDDDEDDEIVKDRDQLHPQQDDDHDDGWESAKSQNDEDAALAVSINHHAPRISSMQAKLDHTKLDSSLYTIEKSEVNNDGGEEEVIYHGGVHVSLFCDPSAGMLNVRLVEARDLRPAGITGTLNPYAKIRLLPNKTNVWQTRIHKRTLHPIFDEDFVFEVQAHTLPASTLEVTVYNFDAYARHQPLGVARFGSLPAGMDTNAMGPLEKLDLWADIEPLTAGDDAPEVLQHGELMVSLSYLGSAERLTVVIIKARNLRVVDFTRNSADPYVKVHIVHNGKRIKKKKTAVHRNSTSPLINEALTFNIGRETLRKCALEFYVMHDNLLGAGQVLGMCRFGYGCAREARTEEQAFLRNVLTSKHAATQWLPLAMTTTSTSTPTKKQKASTSSSAKKHNK